MVNDKDKIVLKKVISYLSKKIYNLGYFRNFVAKLGLSSKSFIIIISHLCPNFMISHLFFSPHTIACDTYPLKRRFLISFVALL